MNVYGIGNEYPYMSSPPYKEIYLCLCCFIPDWRSIRWYAALLKIFADDDEADITCS